MAIEFNILKEAVVSAAAAAGLEEYEIYYTEGKGMGAETFRHEISAFNNNTGGSINFRCKVGGRMGYASTQLMAPEEMTLLIERAVENAGIIENNDEVFIYEGSDHYQEIERPPFTMPAASVLRDTALACQETLYAADEMVTDGTECGVYANESIRRIFNSKGLDLENHVGNTGVYMGAVVDDGKEKQTAYEQAYNCIETMDKREIAERAVERAKARLGARLVKSGKYDVVFDGRQMRALLSVYASVFSAEAVQKGLSLLKDKVGTKIAADCVTLTDTPFFMGNTMQTAFDGEGVATYEKNVVENGVLQTLLYNLTSAKKDGVKSTGNASRSGASITTSPFSFYIQPGAIPREELFSVAGDGLFVTELKGLHAGADSVTGDFSIESAGFLIRNGKLAEPVKSFTVAGNFFALLLQIEMLSSCLDMGGPGFTQFGAPDVLVRGMSVAGE